MEAIMRLIIYGDFNCPYSYLASQRMETLVRLGHQVQWRAVEHDPGLPMTGTPSAARHEHRRRELDEVATLALPGEQAPTRMPGLVSNTYAATAAYAESIADGVSDPLRRALFQAIWVRGEHLSSGYAVRPIITAITSPPVDTRSWLGLELPLPGLESPDPATSTRRFGGTVAPNGAPLTVTGWQRIGAWRSGWLALGRPVVPVAVDIDGTAHLGLDALTWLASLLPESRRQPATRPRVPTTRPAAASRTVTDAAIGVSRQLKQERGAPRRVRSTQTIVTATESR
jgi:DSBA-like thioredoxin domain-containing protein